MNPFEPAQRAEMTDRDRIVPDAWFVTTFNKYRISVHAAQVAFFIMVSLFPFLMFLAEKILDNNKVHMIEYIA